MQTITAVVILALALGLFLALRELWCWYWKINAALEVLNDMKLVLRNIDNNIAASTKVAVSDEKHFNDPR